MDALRSGPANAASKVLKAANKMMPLVDAYTGIPFSMATRPLQAGLERMGGGSAAKAALNPNIEAMISAALRRAAKGRVADLLRGLPMSQAAAAAYNAQH
jgi:hypothetical protein